MAPSSPLLLVSAISLTIISFLFFSLRTLNHNVSDLTEDISRLSEWQKGAVRQALQLKQSVKELNGLLQELNRQRMAIEDHYKSQQVQAKDVSAADAAGAKPKKESVLIYYDGTSSGYWPDWAIELTGMYNMAKDCPVKCKYTSDASAYKYADAVLHFCLGFKGKRKDGKIEVMQCTEPFVNDDRTHLTFNPETSLTDFDIAMTYDPRVSDLPITFGVWPADRETFCNEETWLREVGKARSTKSSKRPSCFFAANCAPERTKYVEEMMKYHGVDSYGPCLHNIDDEEGSHTHNAFDLLISRSSSHKFCLAFDKQQTVGYISERLPLAYRSGCLPVYWGAGDADDYEPGKHSYINANDFKGPKELAEHLNYLDKNDTAYEEYFEWKNHPLSQAYLDYIKPSHCASVCNLCVKVAELRKEREAQ